jgi:hypothetical protein
MGKGNSHRENQGQSLGAVMAESDPELKHEMEIEDAKVAKAKADQRLGQTFIRACSEVLKSYGSAHLRQDLCDMAKNKDERNPIRVKTQAALRLALEKEQVTPIQVVTQLFPAIQIG